MTAPEAAATPATVDRQGSHLLRSTLVVAGLRGLDFGLSFLVSVLLANRFGAGGSIDAFFLARRTTVGFADTIKQLVSSIVVPAVVSRQERGEHIGLSTLPKRVWLFVGGFAALMLFGTLIPSVLVSLFAPGFTGERRDLAATLMAILMPLMPVAVIASLVMAMLQANRKFFVVESTRIFQRGLLVLVLAVAIPPLGILAAGWTMLAGGLIGIALLFAAAWPFLRGDPAALVKARPAETPAAGAGPDLGGGVIAAVIIHLFYQLTSLIDFGIASLMTVGAVSALEYGSRLVSLLPGLVMASLVTVLYPELVRALRDPDATRASAGLARYQRLALFVQTPVSIAMMLAAPAIVAVIFGHGAFDQGSIGLTASITAGYAAAAIFLLPLNVTTSAIYVDPRRSCVRDMALIAAAGLALRIILVGGMATSHGAPGIAWGAALSTAATFAVAMLLAIRRFRHFDMGEQLRDIATIGLCGLVGAAAGFGTLLMMPDGDMIRRLATIAAVGLATFAGYALTAMVLRVPEVAGVRDLVTGVVAKKVRRGG